MLGDYGSGRADCNGHSSGNTTLVEITLKPVSYSTMELWYDISLGKSYIWYISSKLTCTSRHMELPGKHLGPRTSPVRCHFVRC